MPEVIQLYLPGERELVVQRTPGMDVDSGCQACPLHKRAGTVCVPPEGKPGGLLVVNSYVSADSDRAGRPMMSFLERVARTIIKKHWDGPVAFDTALKCAPKAPIRAQSLPGMVAACRPYLAQVLEEVKPTRIIALGSVAYRALLDRAPHPLSIRQGYTWLPTPAGDVPIFLLPGIRDIAGNRLQKTRFKEDLQWALQANPAQDDVAAPWHAMTRIVTSSRDAEEAYLEALEARWVTFDCETYGRMYDKDFRLLSVAVGYADSAQSWVWPENSLRRPELTDHLVGILTDHGVPKVGQNIKFDLKAIWCSHLRSRRKRVRVSPVGGDTRLLRKLIDSDVTSASMETMSELVGLGGCKEEAQGYVEAEKKVILGRAAVVRKALGRKKDELPAAVARQLAEQGLISKDEAVDVAQAEEPYAYAYAGIPYEPMARYNARDVVVTARLQEYLEAKLKDEPEQQFVWDELVGPASEAFAVVESWGMPVSVTAIKAFSASLHLRLDAAMDRLRQQLGDEFNPASPQQVAALLQKTGVQIRKKTKTGAPSTDLETLQYVAAHVKSANTVAVLLDIIEHRKVTKMISTYADGMLEHVRDDGRIHTQYNLDGARTGRLSSSGPNLQNIPRADSPEGKAARNCFVADHGKLLVQFDYSQLELRVAADLSGDPEMIAIFHDGVDYHQRTAELISKLVWNIPPSAVQKQHRSGAKAFNFGILYGMSDAGIALRAGCTKSEAQAIRRAILGKFKRLAAWIEKQGKDGVREAATWTYWKGQKARRRNLPALRDEDPDSKPRVVEFHSTWNTPVQGTASDYCLASVVALVRWLLDSKFDAELVGTVHDSILFQVAPENLPYLVHYATSVMESWPTKNGVPLVADVEVGEAWGELAPYRQCDYCQDHFWHSTYYPGEKVCDKTACVTAHRAALLLTQSNQ